MTPIFGSAQQYRNVANMFLCSCRI